MHLPKRYLVTSALPYANGPQHVGHLAELIFPRISMCDFSG